MLSPRWEFVTWLNGRHGTLLVTHGKTAAARRLLPMTLRVRTLLEKRWEATGKPVEGWVWPAPTESGHIEPCSLKKQPTKALRLSKVRAFVLYSLRHTFLTRLILRHTKPTTSLTEYIQTVDDSVQEAVERLAEKLL